MVGPIYCIRRPVGKDLPSMCYKRHWRCHGLRRVSRPSDRGLRPSKLLGWGYLVIKKSRPRGALGGHGRRLTVSSRLLALDPQPSLLSSFLTQAAKNLSVFAIKYVQGFVGGFGSSGSSRVTEISDGSVPEILAGHSPQMCTSHWVKCNSTRSTPHGWLAPGIAANARDTNPRANVTSAGHDLSARHGSMCASLLDVDSAGAPINSFFALFVTPGLPTNQL